MGTKHENDNTLISQIGSSLAEDLAKSPLTENTIKKVHDELESYDKDTQLKIARATFDTAQDDYSKGKTTNQLTIHTENVQKLGQAVGGYWLHAMTIETDNAPKPTNWSEHPIDSIQNSIENLFTPARQVINVFEETEEEHNKQVAEQGSKAFQALDFMSKIK